jgi:hypothetical protein
LLAGATGWLLAAGAVVGCAGSLDPSLTGSGGTTGTGSGGNMGSGGGGSTTDCTGDNDGAKIVMNQCTTMCHSAGNPLSVGLDLTNDSGLSARLVGVTSKGGGLSACGGNSEPYLMANSNPASGLLIDKMKSSPPCGDPMPFGEPALSATQQQCVIQWATTLTKP